MFEEVGAHIYRNSGEAARKGKLGVVEGCNGLYQTFEDMSREKGLGFGV